VEAQVIPESFRPGPYEKWAAEHGGAFDNKSAAETLYDQGTAGPILTTNMPPTSDAVDQRRRRRPWQLELFGCSL